MLLLVKMLVWWLNGVSTAVSVTFSSLIPPPPPYPWWFVVLSSLMSPPTSSYTGCRQGGRAPLGGPGNGLLGPLGHAAPRPLSLAPR